MTTATDSVARLLGEIEIKAQQLAGLSRGRKARKLQRVAATARDAAAELATAAVEPLAGDQIVIFGDVHSVTRMRLAIDEDGTTQRELAIAYDDAGRADECFEDRRIFAAVRIDDCQIWLQEVAYVGQADSAEPISGPYVLADEDCGDVPTGAAYMENPLAELLRQFGF
jgi:hypothetical protein